MNAHSHTSVNTPFPFGYHSLSVGTRKNGQTETNLLNMVVCDSSGASVPWYVSIQLRSWPVEQLRQYLNGTFSHQSSLQYSSTQHNLNSKQLQLSLSLYDCYGHCHIVSLQVFVWSLEDHRMKYQLDKGHAGPKLL